MTTNLHLTLRRREPGWCASLLAFALASGTMACSDGAPITGPTPSTAPAAPPPAGSWVVRGSVFEHLPVSPDVRPLAGVPLRVFGAGTVVEVISGADGSYEADVPDTAPFVRVTASGPVYFTPCGSFRSGGAARVEEPLDVHVVSGATLSMRGAPHSYPTIHDVRNLVYGRVLERRSGGLEPVAGATVTLHGTQLFENFVAATLTSATGDYFLCSATPSVDDVVEARKEGYAPASVPAIYDPWDFVLTDLELARR